MNSVVTQVAKGTGLRNIYVELKLRRKRETTTAMLARFSAPPRVS
jgi:hypothetical protein